MYDGGGSSVRTFLVVVTATLLVASILVWKMQPPSMVDGRVVLTWVSDDNPARKAQAELFEKLHPNIKLNIDPGNSGVEKVIIQSLAGVGPDVFDAASAFELSAYAKSGIALDVTDELKKSGIDLPSQTFPAVLGTSIYDGHTYGIPTNVAADGVWFHADLLRQEGIAIPKAPWRWEQLIPLAQKLTKRGPDGKIERYGLLFEWWNCRHFFCGFGARVFNENGTRCAVDSPFAIAAVQMMFDLVYKYHVSPTPVEETSMAAQGGFGSGYISIFSAKRGAMSIGGRWWLAQLRQAKGLDLRVVESPFGRFRQSHCYGRGLLVNKNSPHRAQALEFQKFLASDAYLDLINDQADGAAAFRRAETKPSFLFNPHYPMERDNAEWLKITEIGVGDDVSPYVDNNTVGRLIQVQLDLVQAGQKSPTAAMKDAATNINLAIAKSITEDASLGARYRKTIRELPR
jgi:multiple sugar transport system substrate-binding protein